MAHFAKLDADNVVLEVNVVANAALDPNDEEGSGIAFLTQWSGGYYRWKQCSYNGTFRKQYPGPGYRYDAEADVFIAPQPYDSWTLDANFDWQPPVPMPSDGGPWVWDEIIHSWVEVTA